MMEDDSPPVTIQELVQLSNLGVSHHDVTWTKVTMTSDKHICVRCSHFEDHTDEKLMVLDLTSVNHCLQFLPYKADGAMVSLPSSNGCDYLLALKDGDTTVVVGLEPDSQTHYSCDISEVQYWTWISSDMLAFVTDSDVLHWTIGQGTTPQKVFCRHSRLNYSEIVGYKADNTMTWFAITGLLPQTDGIYGVTQLYFTDKQLTQCITAHAVTFTEYRFQGNQFPSTVLCVAGRESNGHGKVDVIELEPHVPGNLALGTHCDLIPFSGSGEKYDFPISIQASSSYGVLYIITKYGFLYLSDLETATCLCCIRISTAVVFTSTLSSLSQGIIIVNRSGQVQAIDIKPHRLIHHVEKVLKKSAHAERLRKALPLVPLSPTTCSDEDQEASNIVPHPE